MVCINVEVKVGEAHMQMREAGKKRMIDVILNQVAHDVGKGGKTAKAMRKRWRWKRGGA